MTYPPRRGIMSIINRWGSGGFANAREYSLVPFRRACRRAGMGARGLPVVRDDRRHSHRSAMLQACRACLLSVRQGGRLRRRGRFVHRQCVLDPVFWAGAGAWLPCSRLPVVHNHYRHTVWQAVLQNGAACAHAVRRIRAVNGAAARAFCPRALCTRFPAAELKYIFLSGCGQMVRRLLWERVTAS